MKKIRAFEIILFIILLQAAIGFTNGIGLFEEPAYTTPPNKISSWNISTISDATGDPEDQSIFDQISTLARWAWESLFIFMDIILAIVFVYPMLVNTFHVPIVLSVFLQVGVYVLYVWGFMQYKSGKSTMYMD